MKAQEVPTNHLLNLFFRLAPKTLVKRLVDSALPEFAQTPPQLVQLKDASVISFCQPDFCFQSGDKLVFMEMKIKHKLSVDQLLKYALASAALGKVGTSALVRKSRLVDIEGLATKLRQPRSAGFLRVSEEAGV